MARNVSFIKHEEINGEFQNDLKKLTDSAKLLKKSSKTAADDVINITGQLKERLRDTVYRFFAVIDAIDDLVCIKDCEGRWKTLNSFGQSLYNLNRDDYYGKTVEEIVIEFPQLTECLSSCLKTDAAAWAEGKSIRNTQQFVIGDNEYFFDIIKTPVYTYNGDPKELIIIGRDVTNQTIETQKNRACLTALNSASDSIALLDKHHRVIFFNNAFTINFPLIENGKLLSDVYKSVDEQYEINKLNQLERCEIWNQELSYIVNGEIIICEEEIIPIMNGNLTPIHYICLLRFPK